MNARPEGKTKFLFPISPLASRAPALGYHLLSPAKFLSETEAKPLGPELLQPSLPRVPVSRCQDC